MSHVPAHAFDAPEQGMGYFIAHASHTSQHFCRTCRAEVCDECSRVVIQLPLYGLGELCRISPSACGHGRGGRLVDDGSLATAIFGARRTA